jgi:hypothetical protein
MRPLKPGERVVSRPTRPFVVGRVILGKRNMVVVESLGHGIDDDTEEDFWEAITRPATDEEVAAEKAARASGHVTTVKP